jgi:glycine/D-amino acid oxidase-like deaminating enzyme
LKAEACRLYPQLADIGWDFGWGGYVAVTREHTPRLMRLAPGVFAGLGYNGRGVAMATMMGKQLALAILGEDPDMMVEELRQIPFHGLRQIGVSWHLLTGGWLDRLDRLR